MESQQGAKEVRLREEEPLDDGGDDVMLEEKRSTPFSFRYVVLNNGSEDSSMENDWRRRIWSFVRMT